MSYELVVRSKALIEAATVYAYYRKIRPELAEKFAMRLGECYSFIARDPTALPIRKGIYRHIMVPGFKYRVAYAIHEQQVVVVQVRHTSRRVSQDFGPAIR